MLHPPRPGQIQRTAIVAPRRRARIALPREFRRSPSAPSSMGPDEVLRCGDLVIDVAAHQAFAGGAALPLSHLQFVLLAHLVRHAGRVVPGDELARVAAAVGPTHRRTIASAVSRLRRHLGTGRERPTIAASRARGYQLDPPA